MKHLMNLCLICFTIFLFSCVDPCANNFCSDKGECNDGTCLCEDGYEGENCEFEIRSKYLGTFVGELTCPSESPMNVAFKLIAGDKINEVLMSDPNGTAITPDIGILEGNVISFTLESETSTGETVETLFEFRFIDLNNISLFVTYDLQDLQLVCQGPLGRI